MNELPKAYDPKKVEEKWSLFWESQGFFRADPESKKPPYSIVLPPPNVTGVLHMGHALVNTLQDILSRFKRMSGFEVLWAPGTDHAGIATQTVVEKALFAETGKRRKEFSREEFVSHIWKWKEKSEATILSQLKKLGSSCDFSRLRFTMDDKSNRAVKVLFKKMYDEGLIYQGDYLVNWDPVTQTALADDEVEYEEKQSHLWHFRYPLKDRQDFIVIATTRPETLLGDTAIAVHPDDPRFISLIGQYVVHPFLDRSLPIIADSSVDPKFGTGAVKITPAHDPNDYEMAKRHNLEMINIMTPDGKINENGGVFSGLSMEQARKELIKKMEEKELIEKIEPYHLRYGVSYRSKAPIQPYLSKQWFVKMSAFKEDLITIVKEKKVEICPSHWEATYFHWIENLRDWCISRQLYWGHQIPIWYRKDDKETLICYTGEGLPKEVEKEPHMWEQDPDVLDTWFSSALWPLTILGWPDKTKELEKFYPTSTLITGHDILFFWVAKMILMGKYITGEVPFHQTFIHGLIYGKSYWRVKKHGAEYVTMEEKKEYDLGKSLPKDVHSKWEKMSKSKGNVIDPLEVIDEYGTDAIRMALTSSVTYARQIDLDRRRFEEFKNFANKVWNGARFVLSHLEDLTKTDLSNGIDPSLLSLEDRWILSRFNQVIANVNTSLEEYAFDKAAMGGYEFFWKEFCAYYLELTKPILFGKIQNSTLRKNKQKILLVLLTAIVRLLHPMAPFITEELFSLLKNRFDEVDTLPEEIYLAECLKALASPSCTVAPYPKVLREKDINSSIESEFAHLEKMVHVVRNIRAEMQIPLTEPTQLYIFGEEEELNKAATKQSLIQSLVKIESFTFTSNQKDLDQFGATSILGPLKLFIPLPEKLKEKEKKRLEKEHEKLSKFCQTTFAKLDNPKFRSQAPKEVVDNMTQNLGNAERQLIEIQSKLKKM